MIKFSASLDTKNFSHENRLSRDPMKFENKNSCLIIISRFWGRICTFSNWFRTSHWDMRAFFRLCIRTRHVANEKWIVFFEKSMPTAEKLLIVILKSDALSTECTIWFFLNAAFVWSFFKLNRKKWKSMSFFESRR